MNALVLDERLKSENKGTASNSRLEGRVQIGTGANVVGSTIRGPVAVAEDCQIENSTIGPHTSIGKGTRIRDSYVQYCVIEEGSSLEGGGHEGIHLQRVHRNGVGAATNPAMTMPVMDSCNAALKELPVFSEACASLVTG